VGLEPTPSCLDRILSPARLPFRHFGRVRLSAVYVNAASRQCSHAEPWRLEESRNREPYFFLAYAAMGREPLSSGGSCVQGNEANLDPLLQGRGDSVEHGHRMAVVIRIFQ
jgi:hypothetical protein